jgi:hypothetical protein
MNEKDLAKALLRMGASEMTIPPGSPEQTQRILARDRRRLRLLAGLTLFFWMGSAALLYGFMFELIAFLRHFPPAAGAAADPNLAAVYKFLLVLASSIEALIMAFLCTIVLVFASRRAALRQINASLIEISQQLKRFEQQGGRRQ